MGRFAFLLALLGACLLSAVPAAARDRNIDIAPYIEVDQVLSADVQNGDVLTYTTLAAGIDASVHTRRAEVQLSYRYEHRFAEGDNLTDADIHSGLARANVKVTPTLTLEGGALATRARSDIRGDAPGVLVGNVNNVSQVYSLYAGPTLATHVGAVSVNGLYRFGYTKVEAPGFTGVDPSQPPLDVYDDSTNHVAQASLGLRPGVVLPVGLTLSGGWERDNASQLSQRFENKYGRGDVLLPVSSTLALTAGVGYQDIKVTQRDVLLDGNGRPVTDANGRFVTDPNSPVRIAYQFDGIYFDGGVIWRPSPRTQLEAHVGRRYGTISYTGTFSYQPSKNTAVLVNVYDGVTTFGSQLRDGLAAMPTSFNATAAAIGPDYNGCVFGTDGSAGGCLNDVFQSIATAAFRARGVDAIASVTHGRTRYGIGAGYANRKFLAPNGGNGFSVNGLTDESYYLQLFASRDLGRQTTLQGNIFANYYDSGIQGSRGVYSVGGTATIGRTFGRLAAYGSVGMYSFAQDGAQAVVAIDAAIGARYTF